MSIKPDFFVHGTIEAGTEFHILCKLTVNTTIEKNIFATAPTDTKTVWSFLGVKEKYVNFENVYSQPFYHRDGTNYYYPLYFDSNVATERIEGFTEPDSLTFYYKSADITTADPTQATPVATAQTTPPHPDLGLVSYDAIKRNVYYILGTSDSGATSGKFGYYYPLYLNSAMAGGTSNTHSFTGFGMNFYMPNTPMNLAVSTSPNTGNAQAVFYNPYESLMNSTFKYGETDEGQINIELVSSGNYMADADEYKYFTVTGAANLVEFSKTPSDEQNSYLVPSNNLNINTSKIYAGAPYRIGIDKTGASSLTFGFVNNLDVSLNTNNDILTPYIGSSNYQGTASTSIVIPKVVSSTSAPRPDYLNLDISSITQSFIPTANDIDIYFVPAKQSTYSLASHDLLIHLDYSMSDMVLMSPNVLNARPRIKTGPSAGTSSYYSWVTQTGVITDQTKLQFSSQLNSAMSGIAYNYCTGSNTCGSCFGSCDLNKVVNPSDQCVFDSLSAENHAVGGETFTCDHERYYQKSDYVSNVFIENHSNTAIVIVLVIAIILFTGFILYEERNRIAKEFLHLKSKS